MLISQAQLIDKPVMSLQTGKELARTGVAVINPHNLSIIAYKVAGPLLDHSPSYLRVADIREIGTLGFIIDSSDEFLEEDDVINDKSIYEMNFNLIGSHVIDENKNKVGKVNDYAIDIDSFVIQQLIIKRPLLKSLNNDELLVHRSQVVEVSDDVIVIKSGKIKDGTKVKGSRHYVNPFRNSAPQPETIRPDKIQ